MGKGKSRVAPTEPGNKLVKWLWGLIVMIGVGVVVDLCKDRIKQALGYGPMCHVFGHTYDARRQPLAAIHVLILNDDRATDPDGFFEWEGPEGQCASVEGTPIRFTVGPGYCTLETRDVVRKDVELPLFVDVERLDQTGDGPCPEPR